MEWLRAAVDYGLIGLMGALSVVAVAIAFERVWFYRRVKLEAYADKNLLEIDLTSKLHIIATIGSNAPYLGLLGTVLGIMLTFQNLGRQGFMDSSRIMTDLSLALKATAVGLFVAIPAIVLYNFLLRRVKVLLLKWEARDAHEGV